MMKLSFKFFFPPDRSTGAFSFVEKPTVELVVVVSGTL
jgi:hypothetical protein